MPLVPRMLLAIALIPGCALGAGFSGNRASTEILNPSVTKQDMTFYVESDGNDSNSCTSESSPCLTIQGAIKRLKGGASRFVIKHGVTIQVGAGSFAGYVVSGISIEPNDAYNTQVSYLLVKGEMEDVGVSGTLTGWTSQSGATFATATDSGLSMTTDENKGYFLEATSGTGSTSSLARPARWVITSNTSTAFTVLGAGLTSMTTGTGYKVVRPATFITSGTSPASALTNPAAVSIPVNASFGAAYVQNEGVGFAVQNIQFTMGASMTRGIAMQESRLSVTDSRFIATSGTVFPIVIGTNTQPNASIVLFEVYSNLTGTSNSTHISNTTSGGSSSLAAPSMTASMFEGGTIALNMGGSAAGPFINNCYFLSQSSIAINMLGVALGQFISMRIASAPKGIVATETASQGLGNTTFGVTNSDISNCSTAGIVLTGAYSSAYLTNVSGSGNTIGLDISRGAKAAVSSSTTLTGTTEVSIDGSSSDWATMRAASPKIIKDSDYGTAFYE